MKIYPLIFLPALLIFSSCKSQKDYVGPEYVTPQDNFRVNTDFSIADKSVDFTSEKQFFKAEFSDRVSWIITLTGESSGAMKEIKGLSAEIDESNSLWNGKHDGLKFFRDEKVKATLSFLGSDQKSELEFEVTAPVVYPEAIPLGNGFEEGFEVSTGGPWWDPSEDLGSGIVSDSSFQGRKALKIAGKDLGRNYYIGNYRVYYPDANLPNDSSNVYLNVYAFGKGDLNSKLKLAWKEDDDLSGSYEDAIDESWEIEIPLSHKGWKLISVKYSDFTVSQQKAFGGNGNKRMEPHKLAGVDFALVLGVPGTSGEILVDFPTITIGKPFNP